MKRIRTHCRMVMMALAPALSALVALSISAPASAATSGPAPSGATSGWVYYPIGAHLSGITHTTVQGSRAADGSCIIQASGKGTGKAGGPASAVIEIGYNAATCQAKYVSGTLANFSAPSPAHNAPGYSHLVKTGSSSASLSGDPSAYQRNRWLDPFGIQVAAQEQWINWSISGGCDTSFGWTSQWSWYNDGWYKNYASSPSFSGCYSVGTYPHARMTNDLFCSVLTGIPGTSTAVWFGVQNGTTYGDYLEGFTDGSYYWSYNDSKAGGCIGLLHHGHNDS